MSTFFLDVWTFAVSQIGLVAIGILIGEWVTTWLSSRKVS